jgi:hypothetical protein
MQVTFSGYLGTQCAILFCKNIHVFSIFMQFWSATFVYENQWIYSSFYSCGFVYHARHFSAHYSIIFSINLFVTIYFYLFCCWCIYCLIFSIVLVLVILMIVCCLLYLLFAVCLCCVSLAILHNALFALFGCCSFLLVVSH